MSMAQAFTDSNFKTEVIESEKPVLVDFSATWCGPCKQLNPIIEELAQEYSGRVKVGKVDIDDNQETAMNFGITSVTTVILFKSGKAVDTIVGRYSNAVYKMNNCALT